LSDLTNPLIAIGYEYLTTSNFKFKRLLFTLALRVAIERAMVAMATVLSLLAQSGCQ